ncbi:MAG: TonB-dependent copper receptor [Burkholderiaceae bacterium]|nr:TonB-dependent copper receptor [Burkholderiaceae bacterium]
MSTVRHVAAASFAALSLAAHAADPTLDEVVVTAPRMREPLVIENDPRAPQQPVPASDGASFLKNIPGFSVIRKAGTDGDPVLRGLAGSRLNVLLDGAQFHGGCGMRMDPPTAYVFPEAYDRVRIVKGPQTVLYGYGNLAGVVLFERDTPRFAVPGVRAHASLMAGSWGRRDGVADATFGAPAFYLRATATHSQSDDYEDGDGRALHSAFERRSLAVAGGWTPDDDTRIELSAVRSEAQAAYADRMMDGSVFDRDGFGLRFEKRRVSALVQRIRAQVDWNYIDHVMDNYSLRPKPAMMPFSWSNPDRETLGMRAGAELALGESTLLELGLDRQDDSHTIRSFSGPAPVPFGSRVRGKDFDSASTGMFGELTRALSASARLVAGVRFDRFSADRFDPAGGAAVASAEESLAAGFLRYERDLEGRPATVYVGLGRGERPMDHWEATTYGGLSAARRVEPERNTQLDAGLVWNARDLSGSLSAFYSRIDDYVLTFVNPAVAGMCGSNPLKCTALNVDATRYGVEADLAWRFAPAWTLRASYAAVRATNDTMDVALAQTPPDELRLGLGYDSGAWTLGTLARFVRRQDRVHPGYGSIVGQDIGPSAGFATLALNASYRLGKRALISVGVDNVFDRAYAEHISRAAAAVAGYAPPAVRVNEPGRFAWARIGMTFD